MFLDRIILKTAFHKVDKKASKKSLKTGGGQVRLGGALVALFLDSRCLGFFFVGHFLSYGSKRREGMLHCCPFRHALHSG